MSECFERTCALCNRPFRTIYPTKVYCSRRCRVLRGRRASYAKVFPDRNCELCGATFKPKADNHRVCTKACKKVFYKRPLAEDGICSATIGAISELMIAADLLKAGWAVFRAVSPACLFDLVALKDGQSRLLEVRTGFRHKNGKIEFNRAGRSSGLDFEFAVWIQNTREVVFIPFCAAPPLLRTHADAPGSGETTGGDQDAS